MEEIEGDEFYSDMTEEDLREEAKPDSILWQLRIRLWSLIQVREHMFVTGEVNKTPLKPVEVYKDICTSGMFLSRVNHKTKGAFILRPIRDFGDQLDGMITVGAHRMWEILSAPIHTQTGKLDSAAARMVMQAFKLLKEHKYGGTVQKMVTATIDQNHVPISQKTPQLIEEEIRILEDKLKHGKVLDVEEI